MSSSLILSMTTFVYGVAAFFYVAEWIFYRGNIWRAASWITMVGVVGNIIGFAMRWVESYQMGIGHAPLSNLYESLVFFAMAIAVLYLIVEYKSGHPTIGAVVMPLAFLSMAYASLSPDINARIQPLLPALKSNWLIAHVITCFVGYAAFAIAFALSLMFLFKTKKAASALSIWPKIPEPRVLDELTHQMVLLGFLFLTAGIITGAVWANAAWGRYWGWDPKETWSLITWLIYAVLLHTRLMQGWKGRRAAFFSIVGFMAVLFTYFGVNLLPGLHSYGSM